MKNKAFSLIELIIVMAILAIIAAIGTVSYSSIQERMRVRTDIASAAQIGESLVIREIDSSEEKGVPYYPTLTIYDQLDKAEIYISEDLRPQSMKDGYFIASAIKTKNGKKLLVGIGREGDEIKDKIYNNSKEAGWAWSQDIGINQFIEENKDKLLGGNEIPGESDEKYIITFNSNGGTGTMDALEIPVGASKRLSQNTFEKEGYAFAGWSEKIGEEVKYQDGEIYTATKSTTLYAVWEKIIYGDVNDDGNVDNQDVEDLKKYLIGEESIEINTNNANTAQDKILDICDVIVLKEHLAEKEEFKTLPYKNKMVVFIQNSNNIFESENKYQLFTTGETKKLTSNSYTKEGYKFAGWSTVTTGEAEYQNEANFTAAKNTILYPIWEINQYTYNIIYKSTSGTQLGIGTAKYNYGSTNTIRPKEFIGYTSPANQSVKWDSTTAKTITFTYTPTEYTITINCNGGSGVNNQKYTIETETFELGTPSRAGYTFTGWTGDNGTTASKIVSIEKGTTGDKSYKANWGAIQYTYNIVYKSTNGIELGTGTVKYNYGTTNTISPKTFTGYTSPASQSVKWDTTTAKTITFTYTPTEYTITIDCNGGSGVISKKYTIETATFELGTPSRAGYTFAGWTGSNGTTANKTVTINKGSTGNKEYKANWTLNQYTYNIVYKSTSGIELGTGTVKYDYGTTNTISPKTFTGYTSPANQSVKWDTTTAKIITFTYTPIEYTITIDCNGGSGVSSRKYTIETETFKLGTPSRAGYTFTGWTGDNGTTPNKTVNISKGTTGAKSYKANWEKIYKVTFKANGGTGSMTVQTFKDGVAQPLTSNAFIREGYAFNGWSTAADGDVVYKDGEEYMATGDITLYAKWIKTYKVTVNHGGFGMFGTNGLNSFTVGGEDLADREILADGEYYLPYGTTIYSCGVPLAYIRVNGKSADSSPFPLKVVSTTSLIISGKYVEAPVVGGGGIQYNLDIRQTCTVTFNKNDGTGTTKTQSIYYDTATNLTANTFTKSGYLLAGWATTPNGNVKYANQKSITIQEDITLYAVWVQGVTCTITDEIASTWTVKVNDSYYLCKGVHGIPTGAYLSFDAREGQTHVNGETQLTDPYVFYPTTDFSVENYAYQWGIHVGSGKPALTTVANIIY